MMNNNSAPPFTQSPIPSHDAIQRTISDLVLMLREARRELRITQLNLATSLHVAETTVVDWEMRQFTPMTENLVRWAHELGYAVEIRDPSSGVALREPGSSSVRSIEIQLEQIAQILKLTRLKTGLTQDELSIKLGVSSWTVRMWESAQRAPRLVHLVAWCAMLDCELAIVRA